MIPLINPYRFAVAGGAPHWQELGRTTLSSSSQTIELTGISNKPYMMMLFSGETDQTNADHAYQVGNGSFDTGNNYAYRGNFNGGSDYTNASKDHMMRPLGTTANQPFFDVSFINNISNEEKLMINHAVQANSGGAGDTVTRSEHVGKWANTSNVIDRIRGKNVQTSGSRNYKSGTQIVVLGYDPADTSGSSVWEELASNDESSGTNTSTFTSKKYLWVQFEVENSGSIQPELILGSGGSIDTGNNYCTRYSQNGNADGTRTSQDSIESETNQSTPMFGEFFIINKSDKEKIAIGHWIYQGSAGAGTAPDRVEVTGKWANTSAQANILGFKDSGSGSFAASSLKVWGFD